MKIYKGKILGTEKYTKGYLIGGEQPYIVGEVIDSTEEYIVLEHWWPVERGTIEPIEKERINNSYLKMRNLSKEEKEVLKKNLSKKKKPLNKNIIYETIEEKINASIENETVMWIEYEDRHGKITERNVEPRKFENGSLWCYDLLRDGVRVFKVDSIKESRMTDIEFEDREEYKDE